VSFEKFVDATIAINAGKAKPRDYDASLPTLRSTLVGTAILEAGRRSLDNKVRNSAN
jgi:D-galacturonate reductase